MTPEEHVPRERIEWRKDFDELRACIAIAQTIRAIYLSSWVTVVMPGGKTGRVPRASLVDRFGDPW